MWVLGQLDRYILQTNITYNDLNSYDLLLKCFFGIEFLQNSLSSVIFPRIYEIWNKNKTNQTIPESNKFFTVFTIINIFQLIIFCLFIPFLYRLLIKNTQFYDSEMYIGLIAGGYGLRSILNFYLSTILFTKKTNILLKIFGVSSLVQIPLTVILVQYLGLIGAIYASLLTKILQVVFSVIFTKGIFEFRYNRLKIMGIPFLFLLYNILQFMIFPGYNEWLYLAQLLFFSLVIFFSFKKEITMVLDRYILRGKVGSM
jgi:O-antigen/teichoic acid export membrane protein